MTIDDRLFESWMERIAERLDRSEKMLTSFLNNDDISGVNGRQLLDNQDVCQILQISKRSVQRYRSSGMLPYITLRGKIYYRKTDVVEFLNSHFGIAGNKVIRRRRINQ